MIWRKRNKEFDSRECYLQSLTSLDLWTPRSKEDALRYYSFIIDKLKIAIAVDSQGGLVRDYRYAVLYEIAKRKHAIEYEQ